MNCRKHILKFVAGLFLFGVPVWMSAIELPIKKINGEDYYYYEVQPKETVFGLCRRLNLTKAEIVKHNPSVADGLRAGAVLYFPVELLDGKGTDASDTGNAMPAYAQESTRHIPVSRASSHHVKKGETVYGICRHYGISEEDLLALNPSLKSGSLRSGTILLLPDGASPEAVESENATVPATEPEQNRILPVEPTATYGESGNGYITGTTTVDFTADVDADEEEEADTLRVSVMLPFMLAQEHPDKQAQFYTEFYKGFLMAVDSLRSESLPLVVDVYDTSNSLDTVKSILMRPELLKSDLIVAPDGDNQLGAIASFGKTNKINVMNIFAVKSTDYVSNPYILQSNIPHSDMYDRAVEGLLEEFPEHTLVLLSSLDGKSDKQEFVSRLKFKAEQEGHPYVEISYHGYLKGSDLESLSSDKQYLFVPASGAHSEFNHIAGTLKMFKESRDDYNKALLFGYPEWITFPEESIENMQFLNSTIYSRFFNDDSSLRSKDFARNFQKWYGTPLLNAIPVQGILGFDSGFYIIKTLNDNARSGREFDYDYDGIQSSFNFVSPLNIAGKVNNSLYFISFRPSGIVDKHIVE